MTNLILFSFGKITTKIFTRSVRVKYVVCSPTKLVLNLIELLSSTVWRSAHSLPRKNVTKSLISTTSACWIWQEDLFFSIGKMKTLTAAFMHSFRVWYVQCLAMRLTLNLIEFIHLKVWRSSLILLQWKILWRTGHLHRLRVCKIHGRGFRFKTVSKLFSSNSNFWSRG